MRNKSFTFFVGISCVLFLLSCNKETTPMKIEPQDLDVQNSGVTLYAANNRQSTSRQCTHCHPRRAGDDQRLHAEP